MPPPTPLFFESVGNLKSALLKALDRTPSSGVATDVTTCLEQGRLFFNAASLAPLEIRPLLLLYGIIPYSRALVCGRRLASLSTLSQAHGITDTSTFDARLSQLKIKIGGGGSFQEFSDTVRGLDFIDYYGSRTEPLRIFTETDESSKLKDSTVGFDEIFSRLYNLHELYTATFEQSSQCTDCSIYIEDESAARISVVIKDYAEISFDGLVQLVTFIKSDHKFLDDWVFCNASCNYGSISLDFYNLDVDKTDELALAKFDQNGSGFTRKKYAAETRKPLVKMPPICGALSTGGIGFAKPLNGVILSQQALTYMAAFVLGSLVRYRPQTWIHALRSKSTPERPEDDRAIALIEQFLNDTLETFPNMIMTALTVRKPDVAER
tara:strand:+ start:286 stop:1425 length:1140 start_codon:yes stop_codon:yes gene_type:complete